MDGCMYMEGMHACMCVCVTGIAPIQEIHEGAREPSGPGT